MGQPQHPPISPDARARPWLTAFHLPAYAPEFDPVEAVWAHMKKSLANLATCNVDQLLGLVRNRLKRIQYRRHLLGGFLAKTGLNLQPP